MVICTITSNVKLTKKEINYIKSLKREKINKVIANIEIANRWLSENRAGTIPVSFHEVVRRLLSSSSFLGIESDVKTTKGSKKGYLTGILYLAPYNICGINICPFAITCREDCLFGSGRGRHGNVARARIIKTIALQLDRELFELHLINDIKKLKVKAIKKNMLPVVRLNGTSDLLIEKTFAKTLKTFPEIQFYDYTKNPNRFKKELPTNYDLTFSYDGVNDKASLDVLQSGGRVAVVFKNGLPATFMGFEVIDGDSTDLRFLDGNSLVVGLNAKGSAKKETANEKFIVDLLDERCGLMLAS